MKSPSLRNFIVRVGGLAGIYLVAIFVAKQYAPGHEDEVIYVITIAVIVAVTIKGLMGKKPGAE